MPGLRSSLRCVGMGVPARAPFGTPNEEVSPMQMVVATTSPLVRSLKVTLATVSSVVPSDLLTDAIGRRANTSQLIGSASPFPSSRRPLATNSSRSSQGT
jgi:hypothetical protein